MNIEIPTYVDESHKIIWQQFTNWCKHNSVDISDSDADVKPHWDCFLAGTTAMYLLFKQGKIE